MASDKHQSQSSFFRPPVVAVLGHVDHGKTSLLDYIRKASVAAKEHGGITQHIGAYQVEVTNDKLQGASKNKQPATGNLKPVTNFITFIDTPGHEAFAKMRSRGASAADIAILVVAADDSVKPQTIDSIRQIKDAKIPMIVAMNKIDLEGANPQKVKQDLAKYEVQVEGFGGDIPLVPVSAKTGKGIPELLETIHLLWEVALDTKPLIPHKELSANVIETQIDKGKGLIATVIVKTGTLIFGTKLFEGEKQIGKVRAMFDEWGSNVKEAGPGKPVQILGFDTLPTIGMILHDSPQTENVVTESPLKKKQIDTIPDFLKPLGEIKKTLPILLKVDTAGSLEAIQLALPDTIEVVSQGFGDIGEKDILDARANKAFIVGFNVACKGSAAKLAETEKVVYRIYNIIYELIDELTEVAEGMQEITTGEREVGMGTILAQFPFDKQMIAGTKVESGRLAKGDIAKIMRGDQEVARAKIKSLRQGKLEVTKVEKGEECGVLFDKNLAFSLNDVIISLIK